MRVRHIATDLALSTAASYLATKVMEPVSTKLYELESEADRAREDAARPGPPDRVAAEKTTRLVGLRLSDTTLDLTPAFGFSAPNRSYPLATHARGFVAHLVFGLAVAAVTEAGWGLLRQRP